ncbi:hypothetical protein PENSPDRAFT_682661 [Peniophora sp. CONT]|nr:hypothetical protein PENSPDRAFT_682661 [Peniophora sp. CONT]
MNSPYQVYPSFERGYSPIISTEYHPGARDQDHEYWRTEAYLSPMSPSSPLWASPASSLLDNFGGARNREIPEANILDLSYAQLGYQLVYEASLAGVPQTTQVASGFPRFGSSIDLRHLSSMSYMLAPHQPSFESYGGFEGYGESPSMSCPASTLVAAPEQSSPTAHTPAVGSECHRESHPPQLPSATDHPRIFATTRSRARNRSFRKEEVAVALALAKDEISAQRSVRGSLWDGRFSCILCNERFKAKSIRRHFESHRDDKRNGPPESVCCGAPRPAGGGESQEGRVRACWKVFSRKDALQRHIQGEFKKTGGCRGDFNEMQMYWQAHGHEIELE